MAERYPQRPDMRSASPGGNTPESDPLAELARLIGQTDPFGTMGRANARPAQPSQQAEPHFSHEQDAAPEPPGGRPAWLRNLPHYRDTQDTPDQHASGAFDAHAETGWHQPQPDTRYDNVLYGQGQDPYAEQRAQYPQGYQEAGHQQGYPQDAHAGGHYAPDQYAQGQYAQQQYEQDQYAQQDQQGQYAAQGQYDPYQRDAYPYRAAEDDEPVEVSKRRAGVVTALVVLGFAVVGTAGAFAFKSYVMSPRSGEPPVIRADASPTKIAPAGAADPGKINDRVSGSSERLVPREEQPVDVRDQTKARIVFPPPGQPVTSPANANAAAMPGDTRSPAVPAASDEPKRLKTIPIRGNAAASTPAATTPSPSSLPVPPAKRVATTPVTSPPATRSAPATTNSTGGNQPMSIAPQSSISDNARVAAVQPTAREPEPTASGGYVVQLSSQPSEAEARSSFRSYQTKYASVMSGRQPIIKRVDFGAKGVWYRAQTGPFASSEDASNFCKSLTAVGGNCIVQRN